MTATTGVQVLGSYLTTGAATGVLTQLQANLAALLALVPNPDTAPAQGGGGFLDEMSPAAAAQLRVEIQSLQALG